MRKCEWRAPLLLLKTFTRMSLDVLDVSSNIGKEHYPNNLTKAIQYGTAGFRDKAAILDCVMYRMGLLSVLRSKQKKGKTIGLMVTASHNPEIDNGVKLVDPEGEMLEQSWESLATQLVNTEDAALKAYLSQVISHHEIDISQPSNVVLGQDTRESSPRLSKAALDGIKALSSSYTDQGVVTTPMLHYFVLCKNTDSAYGIPTADGYYTKLSHAFKLLNTGSTQGNYTTKLIFDGANGVGALKMRDLCKYIPNKVLEVEIYNDGSGRLNYECGADYVKVHQKAPQAVPAGTGARSVSVDGDADRLIYWYKSDTGFQLLDGDRIATLLAGYLMELLQASFLKLNLGLVQTAYANGASTEYISNTLKVPVACVPTGVKHLHHRALQFDIGVYFEANGHGTVVFSKSADEQIRSAARDSAADQGRRCAAERLGHMIDLTNQTVGDSLSDILLVETVLRHRGWSLDDWARSYADLPNRLMKVTIKDRNVVETTDAERRCVKPAGLQSEIDKIVARYSQGRAFVRPSGTEDVVRVYAEAATQAETDRLAVEVALAVYELSDGLGPLPSIPS